MKTSIGIVFTHDIWGVEVRLTQQGADKFTVRYGKQVTAGLDYAKAAYELGCCLMHALACEGMIDNENG